MSINRGMDKDDISQLVQSCPTPCNPMDCSMPACRVHHQLPELKDGVRHTHTHTHTHTRILLSHKKEWNCAICRDMDGPRACHTEWSKSEREKQASILSSYMWNLENWYRWTYLQSRKRDTCVIQIEFNSNFSDKDSLFLIQISLRKEKLLIKLKITTWWEGKTRKLRKK